MNENTPIHGETIGLKNETIQKLRQNSKKYFTHAIERANRKCEICGFGSEKFNLLQIHHIQPIQDYWERFLTKRKIPGFLFEKFNLVALCPNCHLLVHRLKKCTNRNHSTRLLSEIDNMFNNHSHLIDKFTLLSQPYECFMSRATADGISHEEASSIYLNYGLTHEDIDNIYAETFKDLNRELEIMMVEFKQEMIICNYHMPKSMKVLKEDQPLHQRSTDSSANIHQEQFQIYPLSRALQMRHCNRYR